MVYPTCFGIILPSSGRVPSAFWEMLIWGAVDIILWMDVLCLVTSLETPRPSTNVSSSFREFYIWPDDGHITGRNNCCQQINNYIFNCCVWRYYSHTCLCLLKIHNGMDPKEFKINITHSLRTAGNQSKHVALPTVLINEMVVPCWMLLLL
jgi:hypothetical protein